MVFDERKEIMEKLTFEQVIIRHISKIAYKLSEDGCLLGAEFEVLEALLSPYLDDDFKKDLEKLNDEFGKDRTFMLKKEGSLRLDCFIRLLDRLDMLLTSDRTSLV